MDNRVLDDLVKYTNEAYVDLIRLRDPECVDPQGFAIPGTPGPFPVNPMVHLDIIIYISCYSL